MSGFQSQYGSFRQVGFGGGVTWGVQRIILATTALFAVQLLLAPLDFFLDDKLFTWFAFRPGAVLTGALWQPFTYMFLHVGLWHLFMNMLGLFFFGPEVERELGTPQFYRMYIFCGALGVLATFFPYLIYGQGAQVSPPPVVMGASGATMGVLVAFVVLDPQREVRIFPLPFPITALWMLIFFLVMNLLASMEGQAVSVATHFGGMAAGFAYMKIIPKANYLWRKRKLRVVPKPGPQTKPPQAKQSPPDWDKIGKVVDDILRDKAREKPPRGDD